MKNNPIQALWHKIISGYKYFIEYIPRRLVWFHLKNSWSNWMFWILVIVIPWTELHVLLLTLYLYIRRTFSGSLLCTVYSWSLSRTFSGSLIAMYCLCLNCPSNVPFLALLTQTYADDGQSGVAPEPVPGVKSFSRKHDIGALMVLKRHEKN